MIDYGLAHQFPTPTNRNIYVSTNEIYDNQKYAGNIKDNRQEAYMNFGSRIQFEGNNDYNAQY